MKMNTFNGQPMEQPYVEEPDYLGLAILAIEEMDNNEKRELGEQAGIEYREELPDEWVAEDLMFYHYDSLRAEKASQLREEL